MIPLAFITQWKKNAPWINDYQIEQDLIIERALVEIFSHKELRKQLAFRGGTALHKIYLKPQARYSEDIDLVQIDQNPIGEILTLIREKLNFIGKASYSASGINAKLIFSFNSETEPIVPLKLKIEINTREHFSAFGFKYINHMVKSDWFDGVCELTTYSLEELLSTKLRALYQRRKGRDLFDIYYACQNRKLDYAKVLEGFIKYLAHERLSVTQKEFIANMEEKILQSDFTGDTVALLRPEIDYDHNMAWGRVKELLIEKLD